MRNFDLLTRARARTGHNMSPATAPCARAPGGAMRAPGSRCIFTVLAISAMRGPQNEWLAGCQPFLRIHACIQGCLHAFRAACMHVNGIFSQPASRPARGPRPPDMAKTVKMHRLPGACMPPPGARAQGAVARDILWPVRARARVSRSKFHKIRAPQCQSAVKMGGRTDVVRRIY